MMTESGVTNPHPPSILSNHKRLFALISNTPTILIAPANLCSYTKMQILIFVLYSGAPDFIQFRKGYLVIFAKEKPQEVIELTPKS